MLKILLGNLLFAGCVVGWYFYSDGDHGLLLAGTILAFGCFLSGILMGYLLRGPAKKRRMRYRASADPFAAPPVFEEDIEQEEMEAEEQPFELQAAIEPDQDEEEELEPSIAIAAPVAEPLETITFAHIHQPIPEIPAPLVQSPKPLPPVEIHEPAAKVVLDSDGCYEMVVPGEPAPFIPDDEIVSTEAKKAGNAKRAGNPSLPQTTPDTSEFTL